MNRFVYFFFCFFYFSYAYAQSLKEHQKPNILNPILPGYFADPTIKKIGDTYYIYATTDGNGWGAGPSQVWTSKDFHRWTIQPMNWPNTHWYWAPDMTQGYDGRYYLYYSQPVEIFGAVSDTPIGPWRSLAPNEQSIIPNYLIPGVITLDAQTFTDDDSKKYMFWGTWGIYPDHGCAAGLLKEDMKSFEKLQLIPNTVAKEFFEAPFMFKRDGVYYLMYSSGHCEDHTYRVQYVKSTVGPMGPFEYPEHNPILVTNEDGTIHGPGHHSILEEDGRYFIVYHRHNNPHSGGGFHRQVAVDELFFTANGDIKNVAPTHSGVKDLLKGDNLPNDLAFGKKVSVSSYYNEDFRPSFLVDNNNGTLWRAKENSAPAWFNVDLGGLHQINTIELQFEYPTYAYKYYIETSQDGKTWETFVDRSDNNRWGSPILEHKKIEVRYVRVHVLDTQIAGLPRGLWNVKVYSERVLQETVWSEPVTMLPPNKEYGRLLYIDAASYQEGQHLASIHNSGSLGGNMTSEQHVTVKNYQGKKAFYFDGTVAFKSEVVVPEFIGGNSPYTVSMHINNPHVGRFENILSWSKGNQDLTKAIVGYGSDSKRGAVIHGSWPDLGYSSLPKENRWHHIVISFDGYMERIYVNGLLQYEGNRMLFVRPGDHFVLGASDIMEDFFSGYLAHLEFYNVYMPIDAIQSTSVPQSDDYSFFSIQTDDLPPGRIRHLVDHGSVQYRVIQVEEAEVVVEGQRTAVRVGRLRDEQLAKIFLDSSYTLDFDYFDGENWNHVVAVFEKTVQKLFINGKSEDVETVNKLVDIVDGDMLLKYPFHALYVYRGSLGLDVASEKFIIWQQKQKSTLKSYAPIAVEKAFYINPKNVFVQVQKEYEGMLYMFSNDDCSSGWISEPYFAFNDTCVGKEIIAMAKDRFGNVSRIKSIPISSHKPRLMKDGRKYKQTNLPHQQEELSFWDGYQISTYVDSTGSSIVRDNGAWTLRSKNTVWGNQDLTPPFVYKKIKGDFTIEVRIRDVAGLSTQTRTSSESGIMIQSSKDREAYLNNSVITGWSLGNLIRSVNVNQRHKESNTGFGFEFAPYIQVQKFGKYFFMRHAYDGKTWFDLPGSPFIREDLANQVLNIGIYQIAGNNQEGYGVFDKIQFFVPEEGEK